MSGEVRGVRLITTDDDDPIPAAVRAWYRAVPGSTPDLARFRHVVLFPAVDGDTFGALGNAERAAEAVGLVAGGMQAGSPCGLFHNAAAVSKWRGLSARDRTHLDGMILGGHRNCPTCVIVTKRALADYGGT